MKTRIVLLATVLLLSAGARGESALVLAPAAGMASTTIKGSDISGSRLGGSLGLLIDYQLANPQMQLETGVLYTQAGAKDDALLTSVEYELNYLSLPVGARYFFVEPNRSWYTRGGATLSYLVSAKQTASVFGLEASQNVKDQTNPFDVLPYIGFGYGWEIAEGQVLSVDLNYTLGLIDVFKNQKSKSSGIMLNASYSLPF